MLLACLLAVALAEADTTTQDFALDVQEVPAGTESFDSEEISVEALDAEVPEADEVMFGGETDEVDLFFEEAELVEESEQEEISNVSFIADGEMNETSTFAMYGSFDNFIIENGVLTGYTGNETTVDIPNGVTQIGSEAFNNQSRIQVVTIPNTVVYIGEKAFANCYALTSVSIPDTITEIGPRAFQNCKKLSEIHLPDNLICISEGLLSGSSSLKEITIPANVTSIGKSAFYDCRQLVDIKWPAHLAVIGERAFDEVGMTSVIIPDGVTSIGMEAFYYNFQLKDITVPESVTEIGINAFGSSSKDLTLHVTCNSYAQKWARISDNEYRHNMDIIGHEKEPIPEVAATCTENGHTGGIHCSKCGDVFEQYQSLNAIGHNWVNIKGYPATCTSDGLSDGKYCSNCGETLVPQRIQPKTEHYIETIPGVEASYFAPGLTDGSYCRMCGAVFTSQQVIPKQGPSNEFHMSANASNNVVVGQQFQIVLDGGVTAKSFKSNKKKIAKVSNSGLVTAQKKGSAKITIRLTDGRKLTLKLRIGRNKISGLSDRPSLTDIDYGQDIYLKSLEIVGPNKVVAEYWLLFKRLPSISTTKFSYITGKINADHSNTVIVDGTVRNIRIKTRGMNVKSFKVVYKGNSVKNTNINLAQLNNVEGIEDDSDFWLKVRY